MIALDISNGCVKTWQKHIFETRLFLVQLKSISVMDYFKLENELLVLVSGWIVILKVTCNGKQIFIWLVTIFIM